MTTDPQPTTGWQHNGDTATEQVKTLIRLVGVTISYRRPGDQPLTIVNDLDFAVAPGQLLCIAGRSGSGKTSILRVAAGLAAPTTGEVFWQGEPIAGNTADQLARHRRALCGVMDQNAYLLPDLTALENVLIPAVPDRRTRSLRDRGRQLLRELGLEKRLDHRPAALSGGEKQRVALARALLLDPPAVIADEPTASLDRRWADTVIDHLQQATENGTAVLTASHDPHLIERGATILTLD